MYVVRIARLDQDPDYKAFSSLPDAKRRFYAVDDRIPADFDGVALFEAPNADDARKAVEAVKAGHAQLLDRDLWSSLFGARVNH
jgi:hypothetical protein